MGFKQVISFKDAEQKILSAVKKLADPIKQTLGPKGGNVIIQNDRGEVYYTNDGVTIAKEISSSDYLEDAIIQLVKQSSMKTNQEAGDGTSSTIYWSSILIEEGMKMVRDGATPADVVHKFEQLRDKVLQKLERRLVMSDDELMSIATISANNDQAIAENVIKTINTAGLDGLIFLEHNTKQETEILEDKGFIIEQGMFTPELMDGQTYTSTLQDVPVLITDKRLYYPQEAETILRTVLQAGYKQVVIVAQDFIGEALPYFVANHKKGVIKVLLVKDPLCAKNAGATLEDLAVFLGGEVVSDRSGTIVDKLSIDQFIIADKVFSGGDKTVISRYRDTDQSKLDERINTLKEEADKLEDGAEKSALKSRIASLTNGMVTIRIGGATGPEMYEKRFRYEDAISATRAAMKDGYLVGGGVSVYRAGAALSLDPWEERFTKANIRQIAENAGVSFDLVEYKLGSVDAMLADPSTYGFNAKTRQVEDLLEAGVIDPYKVTELAIKNSISIASAVISSMYMVVNEKEDGTTGTK